MISYGIFLISLTFLLLIALDVIKVNFLKIFNTTLYKRVIGGLSILTSLVLALNFVKVLPIFLKLLVVLLLFTFIYFIINTLFKNN